jgi:hypothetical protein
MPTAAGPPVTSAGGQPGPRRRPRRWPLVALLLATLVAVPVGVLLATGQGDGSDPTASADDPADDEAADDEAAEPEERDPGPPDGGPGEDGERPVPPDPDAELEPLDLAALEGLALTYGRLLTDIDASERAMLAFQEGLADAFSDPDGPEAALEEAGEVAAEGQAALLEVRARLQEAVDDPGAERVRALYVDHLDSWEVFMAAVAEDPLMVFQQGEAGFTVTINATADAFSRALEAELPDDIDDEVARFADGILDRGFRGLGYADV